MKVHPCLEQQSPAAITPPKDYSLDEIKTREGVYRVVGDTLSSTRRIIVLSHPYDAPVHLYYNKSVLQPLASTGWTFYRYIPTNEEIIFAIKPAQATT